VARVVHLLGSTINVLHHHHRSERLRKGCNVEDVVLSHGRTALQIGETVSLDEGQFSISDDTCYKTWKPK
jgi:hypothetical protein